MDTIECAVCKQQLPRSNFHRAQVGRKTRKPWCKECCRDYQLLHKFRLTRKQYDELLMSQRGLCAICGSRLPASNGKTRFCVDHDHYTGKIRGLLCNSCNLGIGYFKDDVAMLRQAIEYLEMWRGR